MKQFLFLAAFLAGFTAFAQQTVLPFTGLRYVQNGISADKITMELNGDTWTSNRLPIDTEFEIKLEDPLGFTEEDGLYFPGVEVLITFRNGDTLGYVADMMGGEAFEGFSGAQLSNLSLTLAFNEQTHSGDTCQMMARFFDTKSTNEITTRMELIVVDKALPLENTWSTFGVSSWEGYKGIASGVEISGMAAFRDTLTDSITDFWAIHIDPVSGLTQQEWNAGTLTVFSYEDQGMPTEIPGSAYSATGIASETEGALAITARIPLSSTTTFSTVRVRWESADHTKVVDVVSKLP